MLMQTLCRFAPRRHRVYRLISRLAPNRFEVYRIEGGLIYLNLREHPSTVQVAMGTYEPAKHAMIRRHIRSGMTFIDAGANMGDFTLQAARLVGSSGRVIAIEPAPENFSHLQRSIELNGYSHARALPIALSDRDGTASLQILSLSTAHTLAPLPPQYDMPKVTVPTRTLDTVVAEQQFPVGVGLVQDGFERRSKGVSAVEERHEHADQRRSHGRVDVFIRLDHAC